MFNIHYSINSKLGLTSHLIMRTPFQVLLLSLLSAVAMGQPASERVTIRYQVPASVQASPFWLVLKDDRWKNLDSVYTDKPVVAFTRTLEEPMLFVLYNSQTREGVHLFADKGNFDLVLNDKGAPEVTTRRALNDEMTQFQNFVSETRNELIQIHQAMGSTEANKDTVALIQRRDTLTVQYFDYLTNRMEKRPFTFMNLYLLKNHWKSQGKFFGKEKLEDIPDEYKKYPSYRAFEEDVLNAFKVKVGDKLMDFTLENEKENRLSFGELAGGNITVLDFWASWCGPCIAEFPTYRRLHEQFADKGLKVLFVSTDAEKDKWLKAVNRYQLPWPQVLDTKAGEKTEVRYMYGVFAIPSNFVFDRTGKIVALNLHGPALERKVQELLEN
jgi:thiol-disulfide isomerase/thioredoxin